ncbi:CocE/NonD family hydrolase [Neobacillus vireti]|uniref:CocE/NonD family hydrolase n=1 Tax=Neobacillus vireti TaxID=220686 RepID=UPI002FFF7FD8
MDENEWLERVQQYIKKQYASLEVKPIVELQEPEEIMLEMDDSVRLRTVVYKPPGNGPFPTILTRTCYPGMEDIVRIQSEEYCKRGFMFVYQFCRGTGGSEGNWEPNVNERNDGKNTLDWLNSLNEVESIGYIGNSYLALTGWAVADIVPEKVKTMYLTHYGTDRFTSAYKNGMFRQDVLTSWAMDNAGFPVKADYIESAKYRPHINVDEEMWGARLGWYRSWIISTNRDDSYWREGFWKVLADIPKKVTIPIYLGGGWYDHHLGSAFKTWQNLSPKAKEHSVFRIGAWNHGFMPCVQGVEANKLENADEVNAFNWFYNLLVLKNLPDGEVKLYKIGADLWQSNREYPFQNDELEYFFSTDKCDGAAYVLQGKAPDKKNQLQYIYDPDHPVLSHGAESMMRTMNEVGSLRQPECGWRDDVLSFVSPPLETDLDILGNIKLQLYVSSEAKDTAFTAKVMEIHEDGRSYNIRGSIGTLAYRKNDESSRLLYEPGDIVEVHLDMWDISWRLKAGSRLRVDISSSDFPQYSIHSNHEGIWSLQESAKAVNQTLHFGGDCKSRLILPIEG